MSWPEAIKLVSYSTQVSIKIPLLIDAKMLKNDYLSCFQTRRNCYILCERNRFGSKLSEAFRSTKVLSIVSVTMVFTVQNVTHLQGNMLIFNQNYCVYLGRKVIKLITCSTQLGMKCILLINVKIPNIAEQYKHI